MESDGRQTVESSFYHSFPSPGPSRFYLLPRLHLNTFLDRIPQNTEGHSRALFQGDYEQILGQVTVQTEFPFLHEKR